MKLLRLGLVAAVALLAVGVSRADGVDPVLKIAADDGTNACVQPGNMGLSGSTGSGGSFTLECVNEATTDITQFSFDISVAAVDNGNGSATITPQLSAPLALGWTASCTEIDSGTVYDCTATQILSELLGGQSAEQEECLASFSQSFCSDLFGVTAQQLANALNTSVNSVCENSVVYAIFGVPVGCTVITSGTAGAPGTPTFAEDAEIALTPEGATAPTVTPEPSSLAMLLFGIAGLALVRRRVLRKLATPTATLHEC